MEGLVVIGDMVATGLLALGISRGARGQSLNSVISILAWAMGLAAMAATLSALSTFGGLLLVVLGVGLGASLGALVAVDPKAERMSIYLTGLLAVSGVAAVLLAYAMTDTGVLFWHNNMGSTDVERFGGTALALVCGALVAGGGGALFVRRLRGPPADRPVDPGAGWRAALAGLVILLVALLAAGQGGLASFWLATVLSGLLGLSVVWPAAERDLWPAAILLTALGGLATAAIGFALASVLLIVAGGLAAAAMTKVFVVVCRENGRRPADLVLGRSRRA